MFENEAAKVRTKAESINCFLSVRSRLKLVYLLENYERLESHIVDSFSTPCGLR